MPSSFATALAGDHDGFDATGMQGRDGFTGALLDRVAEGGQSQHTGVRLQFGQPRHGAALGFQLHRLGLQCAIRQAVFAEQPAGAEQ
jgi:hypothetical protein